MVLRGINQKAAFPQYQPVVMLEKGYTIHWNGPAPRTTFLYLVNFNKYVSVTVISNSWASSNLVEKKNNLHLLCSKQRKPILCTLLLLWGGCIFCVYGIKRLYKLNPVISKAFFFSSVVKLLCTLSHSTIGFNTVCGMLSFSVAGMGNSFLCSSSRTFAYLKN